jgi:hypothetical protein
LEADATIVTWVMRFARPLFFSVQRNCKSPGCVAFEITEEPPNFLPMAA